MNNIELKDYFAGIALQAILGNEFIQRGFQADNDKSVRYVERMIGSKLKKNHQGDAEYLQQLHAGIAYQFANEMIKQKEKEQTND